MTQLPALYAIPVDKYNRHFDNAEFVLIGRKLHFYLKSIALVTGFKWAIERKYDYIFEMDADFSHNPDDLMALYRACAKDGADGRRFQLPGRRNAFQNSSTPQGKDKTRPPAY